MIADGCCNETDTRRQVGPVTWYLVQGIGTWYLIRECGVHTGWTVDMIVSYEKSVRGVQGLFITFFFNAYIFTRIPVVRLNIPLPMIISYRYIYCSDPSQNHM